LAFPGVIQTRQDIVSICKPSGEELLVRSSDGKGGAGRFSVVGIPGSLRRGSRNAALLRAARELAPEALDIRIFGLEAVPLYNGDVEAQGDPTGVAALKSAIRGADGVLFATPEYNHGIPGVLKNAIDWASRDRREGSLVGKPVAMLGAGGRAGTARAQLQLQQVLAETGALVMVKPGVFVDRLWEKFDSEGRLIDADTREVLRSHLEAFVAWMARLGTARAVPAGALSRSRAGG
jgi:chromate reductase